MKKYKARGSRVKELRNASDKTSTQKEFSHALGLSERKLRKIENEDDTITRDTAERLGKQLTVPWQSLVFAADGPQLVVSAASQPAVAVAPAEDSQTIPRFDHEYARVVRDEARLYEDAKTNRVVVSQIMTRLTSETDAYVEELLGILEGLAYQPLEDKPAVEGREEIAVRRKIRELLVLLKGNDVWVYATTHIKYLPESNTPVPSAQRRYEFQLVVAFGPPGEFGEESIKVAIDNGQPIVLSAKLPF